MNICTDDDDDKNNFNDGEENYQELCPKRTLWAIMQETSKYTSGVVQRGKLNWVLLISWSSARVQFGPASVPLGNDMLGRKKVLQEVVSIQNVGERVLSFKFLVAERTRLQARVARHFDLEQI